MNLKEETKTLNRKTSHKQHILNTDTRSPYLPQKKNNVLSKMSNLHELLLTTSKIDAKNTIGKNTFQYLTTTAAAETVFSAALCKKRVVTA